MNESSSPSSSPAQSILSLRSLQQILHNRIIQKKGKMHESCNRAYNVACGLRYNYLMSIGPNT
jgi:hypothetical protein